MGFLATLLLAIVFGALGLLRPRVAFYLILALTVSFEELGPGFTTFRGSWVFNAFFVGFYGIRLFEVIVFAAYIPFVLSRSRAEIKLEAFRTERAIAIVFLTTITALSIVEFALTRKLQVGSFRLTLTGMMLFHMMILLFQSEEDLIKLVRMLIALLGISASIGLAKWALGYGLLTPRGSLPFFWDSKQVEAFGLGVVILTSYLINYRAISRHLTIVHPIWASIVLTILAAAVLGSIRRTIWATTVIALGIILAASRRTNFVHYFVIVAIVATTVAGMLFAPGLDNFRSHMGRYVESMNLLSDYQRESNFENQVHITNVQQYSKMLVENPDLLIFGVHGPSGVRLKDLRAEYSEENPLGMAHNGPIAVVLHFGTIGLVLYATLMLTTFSRTWRLYWRADESKAIKHVAFACGIYLLLDFAATLVFVPPFHNSSKGLFYTFLEMFILGLSTKLLVSVQPRSKRLLHLRQKAQVISAR